MPLVRVANVTVIFKRVSNYYSAISKLSSLSFPFSLLKQYLLVGSDYSCPDDLTPDKTTLPRPRDNMIPYHIMPNYSQHRGSV